MASSNPSLPFDLILDSYGAAHLIVVLLVPFFVFYSALIDCRHLMQISLFGRKVVHFA